jgi:hypothetical protein
VSGGGTHSRATVATIASVVVVAVVHDLGVYATTGRKKKKEREPETGVQRLIRKKTSSFECQGWLLVVQVMMINNNRKGKLDPKGAGGRRQDRSGRNHNGQDSHPP